MKLFDNITVRKILFGILLFVILIPGMSALFSKGFFPIHDNEQIARVFELNYTLRAFDIPPRISQHLGFGYGYALFNFYPSFVYYIAEVFKVLGFSYIVSTKIMLGLGFLFAAFFMYLFAKQYFGKTGGFLSAAAYSYAPYHAVDIYVRGAFPEFWSFVFIPAIFWSLLKLQNSTKRRYALFTSLFLAGMILTHNLIAMMSGIFVLIYWCYLLLLTKDKRNFFLKTVMAVVMGFGLSAYFWIPSFFEKGATIVNLLTHEAGSYSLHFVCLRQFWNSPWGYGGSYPGCSDGLSFQIGKIHLMLGVISIFLALYLLLRKKKKQTTIIFLFAAMLVLSIFLQTIHSKFIWDVLHFFWYIQFPWRFLLFSCFTISFIIGGITLFPLPKKYRNVLVTLMILLIVVYNRSYFQPEKYFPNKTDFDYTNLKAIEWDTSSLSFEYAPKGIAVRKNIFGNTTVDIDKSKIAESGFSIVSGDMSVTEEENKPQKKIFTVNVKKSGELRINTFYYPGWELYVDNRKVMYNYNNNLRLITFNLLQGKHRVVAKFSDTPTRVIANCLSIFSLLALGVLFLLPRFRRQI